ncbi:MAG: secretin N-terminal domain-containing protein [Janthinobacterium lividum]
MLAGLLICVAAQADVRTPGARTRAVGTGDAAGTVSASPYPWGSEPFTYFATRTPLEMLLNDFGAQYQVPVRIDPRVRGLADGRLTAATPTAFLDTLAAAHRLDWFYAKGRLYVSRRMDRVARAIDLAGRDAGDAERILQGMGVLNAAYGFVPMPRERRVLVSGPAAYVDLLALSLASLPGEAAPLRFGFFALRHARVYDRTYTFRSNTVVVPGIQQVVSSLLGEPVREAPIGQDAAGVAASSRLHPPAPVRAGSRPPQGSPAGSLRIMPPDAAPFEAAAQQEAQWAARAATAAGPPVSVVADRRLNALIVRGPQDVVDASRVLIERLDVPVPLIQLEAVIIDLKDDARDELGVDLSVATGFLRFDAGVNGTTGTTGAIGAGSNRQDADAPMRTVLPDWRPVMARIRALEQDGRASIVSRPSIVTQNNTAALLDLNESFFIRNKGRDFADTTQVDVGLMINIVPGVVDPEAALPRVTMDIQIEDGEILEIRDDEVPRTKRNIIATQASVRSTESLLIAGHHKRRQVQSERRVPGLSRIPVLGALFRSKQSGAENVRRYFLITPRVLPLEHADLRDVASGMQLAPDIADTIRRAPGSSGAVRGTPGDAAAVRGALEVADVVRGTARGTDANGGTPGDAADAVWEMPGGAGMVTEKRPPAAEVYRVETPVVPEKDDTAAEQPS